MLFIISMQLAPKRPNVITLSAMAWVYVAFCCNNIIVRILAHTSHHIMFIRARLFIDVVVLPKILLV